MTDDPVTTIADMMRAYVGLSAGMRFAEKRLFWDTEEPRPILKPEEMSRPMIGWSAIDAYWGETKASLLDLRSTCRDIVVTPVGPETAIAAYEMVWRATVAGGGLLGAAPIAATVRVAAAARLKPAGWKLFCLIEGHVDGVAYMRDHYRRMASAKPSPCDDA